MVGQGEVDRRAARRGGAACLGVVLALVGCRELNPDFMGSNLSASGSSGVTESGSEDASGTTTTTPSTMTGMSSTDPQTTSTTMPVLTTNTDSGTVSPSSSDSSSGGNPMCGNGVIDRGEDCDDMNADNTDDCLDTCVSASCGDGYIHAGNEDCDGDDLAGTSCNDLGEPGGALACTDCAFDTSDCVCGSSLAPVGGMCPAECNGGCTATTCTIDCGASSCNGDDVVCPGGWNCEVLCDVGSSCRNATITCGDEACVVTCDGGQACRDAAINCGNGMCTASCGSGVNVCNGLDLGCGPNDSEVTCASAGDTVSANPFAGSSCGCMATGC